MAGNVKHGGFESRPYGSGRRKYTARYFAPRYARRSDRYDKDNGSSMLAKMGICVLLAGLVLLSEQVKNSSILEASSGLNDGIEDIGGEYLGKLRFVELPGIMQVFSSGAKLRLGAEYESYRLNDEETLMTVTGLRDTAISAPADGTVKMMTSQDGKTVIELAMDGDMTVSYGCTAEAMVEEGQPVRKGDTLFSSVDNVEIGMTSAGRPVNPAEYYDMGSGRIR